MTTIYAIAGFIMILLFIVLVMSGRVSPTIAFLAIPLVAALCLGFSLEDTTSYITEGLKSVLSTTTMFVFAIIFFSIMSDAGVFNVIVGKLVKIAGRNVTLICAMTVIITVVGQLDGSGATTYLITIPPLYAIYKKMNIRPVILMCLVSLTAGVMNMVPWGGPAGRVAGGLGLDAGGLWVSCIATQAFGVFLLILLSIYFARSEMKRGQLNSTAEIMENSEEMSEEKKKLLRPDLFWFNVLLILVILGAMVFIKLSPFIAFMGGTAIAMTVNYPKLKDQNERMKSYAPSCMSLAAMLLASGAFIGVMSKSPIMDSMVQVVIEVLPVSIAPHLHVLFATITNPLQVLGVSQTATAYNILPIISEITGQYGITPLQVGISWLVAVCPPCFVSPNTAAMYLGLGLCDVELKDHIKMSYKWSLLISLALLVFVVVTGIVPF